MRRSKKSSSRAPVDLKMFSNVFRLSQRWTVPPVVRMGGGRGSVAVSQCVADLAGSSEINEVFVELTHQCAIDPSPVRTKLSAPQW